MNRRKFIQGLSRSTLILPASSTLLGLPSFLSFENPKISLNQWSYFGSYVGDTSRDGWWSEYPKKLRANPESILLGNLSPENFPNLASEIYQLKAIELESSLYYTQVGHPSYFKDFKKRCNDLGVDIVMISNGWQGNLASLENDPKEVAKAYHQWVDITAELGCPSLMVDVNGRSGNKEDAMKAGIEGMSALTEYAASRDVNILAENHNWYSADPDWLVGIVKGVNHPNCGITADFAGFCAKGWRGGNCQEPYDTYEGITKLLPYAKSVSVKSASFDSQGEEVHLNYKDLLGRIRASGFDGYLGIEYVGAEDTLETGINNTIQLLRKYG